MRGGLLAAGAHDDALRVLHYLEATAGGRRTLGAEHVAGWASILEWLADG